MKWLTTEEPEIGYLVTEVIEQRLDGIAKISAHLIGMYSVVAQDTVHVVVPDGIENHHEVFHTIDDAKEHIEKTVLSSSHS